MNILFTICARAGSKGLKGKNVQFLLGYPLVYFTLSAFDLYKKKHQQSYEHLDLAVNTDSKELIRQIEETGISYIYIARKNDLAGDRVSKSQVIIDTVEQVEQRTNQVYDLIIDLDLTSPLRGVIDIEGIINTAREREDKDIIFSVTKSRRSPFFNMVKRDNDDYSIVNKTDFVTRQEAPECFDMNASIYAYKRSFLSNPNYRKVTDGKMTVWEMPDTLILDIDGPEDYQLMQMLAPFFIKNNPHFEEVYHNCSHLRNSKG